jgi:hypothetical protein
MQLVRGKAQVAAKYLSSGDEGSGFALCDVGQKPLQYKVRPRALGHPCCECVRVVAVQA